MKTMLLMSLLSSALLFGCNKVDTIITLNTNQEIQQEFIEGVYVKGGTLHFKSKDYFYEKMSEIERMTSTQFNELALKTGFNSYRRKLSIEQAQRTAKIDAWVDSMKLIVDTDYIIVGNDPFEDELIIPNIQSPLYQSIVDEKGVFYIDGVKNAVDSTHVSGYHPSKTKAGGDILIGRLPYIIEGNTRSIKPHAEAMFRCNKRRMEAYPTKHYMQSFSPDGVVRKYTFVIGCQVEKLRWGKWRQYNSTHEICDVKVDYFTFDNTTTGDEAALASFTYYLPDWAFNSENEFFSAPFFFKFTSRGTGAHGYGVYDSENVDKDQYVDQC